MCVCVCVCVCVSSGALRKVYNQHLHVMAFACFVLCGSFVLYLYCVCHALGSVHCCLVVTCWERADLLALVCDVKLCICRFPM